MSDAERFKSTAVADLKHRVWTAHSSLDEYMDLQQAQMTAIVTNPPGSNGYSADQQRLNSATDAQLDRLLSDVNQVLRALKNPNLSDESVEYALGEEMTLKIRHCRNIREHWDENRPFWSENMPIPPGSKNASARWFKENYPDKVPWSSSWSNAEGFIVCGIIDLYELLAGLEGLEREIKEVERESK